MRSCNILEYCAYEAMYYPGVQCLQGHVLSWSTVPMRPCNILEYSAYEAM